VNVVGLSRGCGMPADFYSFDMKFSGETADHQRGQGRQPGGV